MCTLLLAACGASVTPGADPPDGMQDDAFANDAPRAATDADVVSARDAAMAPGDDAAVGASGCALAGHWHGQADGNASGVDTTLELTVAPDCVAVQGLLHWRSDVSGSNDRTVAGAWDPSRAALTLHDVAIVASQPASGWRFCLVDRYDLTLQAGGDALLGTYDSEACGDHARVTLARVP